MTGSGVTIDGKLGPGRRHPGLVLLRLPARGLAHGQADHAR